MPRLFGTIKPHKRTPRMDRSPELRSASRSRAVTPAKLASVGAKTDSIFRKATYKYDSLEQAFPKADPGLQPFGSDVLIQLKTPPTHSAGGIALVEESRETDQWNMQVGKIIAFGPVCFCNRETLVPWPEGAWAKVGDYVRVPKYGGDRWWVDAVGVDGKALFVLFNDLDLKGNVPVEKALEMVAYI
jgi:co-chaperonin GroES (HSP10)